MIGIITLVVVIEVQRVQDQLAERKARLVQQHQEMERIRARFIEKARQKFLRGFLEILEPLRIILSDEERFKFPKQNEKAHIYNDPEIRSSYETACIETEAWLSNENVCEKLEKTYSEFSISQDIKNLRELLAKTVFSLNVPSERFETDKAIFALLSVLDVKVKNIYSTNEPLYIACANSDIEAVKFLLENRAIITPEIFYKACEVGNLEIVSNFLAYGAVIDDHVIPGNPQTAELLSKWKNVKEELFKAIQTHNNTEVKRLIAYIEQNDIDCFLEPACKNGNLFAVKMLLMRDANINKGFSLSYAAEYGHKDIVCELLKNGAEIERSMDGLTPLHRSCASGHYEIAAILLEAGANIPNESTPLHTACANGHVDIVKLLLNYQATITPEIFCEACKQGNVEIVKLLLLYGARPNIKYKNRTSLAIAREKGRAAVVDLLIKWGAPTNVIKKATILKSPPGNAYADALIHVIPLLSPSDCRNLSLVTTTLRSTLRSRTAIDSYWRKRLEQYFPNRYQMIMEDNIIVSSWKELFKKTEKDAYKNFPHYTISLFRTIKDKDFSALVQLPITAQDLERSESVAPWQTVIEIAVQHGFQQGADYLASRARQLFPGKTHLPKRLHLLIQANQEDEVLRLLDEPTIEINAVINNQTLLTTACANGNPNIIRKLISLGADNRPNFFGKTPLHQLAIHNHVAGIEILRSTPDFDINIKTDRGCSPLDFACAVGKLDTVKHLLTYPDIIPGKAAIANVYKTRNGNHEFIWELLRSPHNDLNFLLPTQESPLCREYKKGQSDIVLKMLENPTLDMNVACSSEGDTFLTMACARDDRAMVDRLLARDDINLNLGCRDGSTALHIACRYGRTEVVQKLLEKGAGPHRTDKKGTSPIDIAMRQNNVEMVELLLRYYIQQYIDKRARGDTFESSTGKLFSFFGHKNDKKSKISAATALLDALDNPQNSAAILKEHKGALFDGRLSYIYDTYLWVAKRKNVVVQANAPAAIELVRR